MKRSVFWLFFGLIIALAIFFRFFKLGAIPVSLYWDETAILIDARSVAATGKDMHGAYWLQSIFPSYGDYKLPVYIWLATLAVKVLGATELAVRLPSALAGVGTVVIAGVLAKELNNHSKKVLPADKLQLAVMFTVATSFWAVMFSRTGFEGHVAQLLVGVSILCAVYSRKNLWWLLAAALVGVLAVYTYYSVRFVWPVVFIPTCLVTFASKQGKANKKNWIMFGVAVSGALLLFFSLLIPMLRSPYYAASQQYRLSAQSILQDTDTVNQANYYRLLAGNTHLDKFFFHRDLLLLKLLLANYSKHLSLQFLFVSGDSNLRHGTQEYGLFALILLLPFGIGLYYLARYNKLLLGVLSIWWLISLLPASVPTETPHALRSLNALIPISIIIGYGLTYFAQAKTLSKKIGILVFWLILSFQVLSFWKFYLDIYPQASSPAWQDGYKQAANYLFTASQAHPENTIMVSVVDAKLYLWLLAYNFYTPVQIQAFPKNNFQLKKINNISFENIDGSLIRDKRFDNELLLMGDANSLPIRLTEEQLQPEAIDTITDSFGRPVFLVAHFQAAVVNKGKK